MRFFAVALTFIPSLALAQSSVSVTITPGADFEQAASALNTTVAQLESELEAQVLEALALQDPDEYLTSFANAQAFSTKGIMADYASNFDSLLIGIGVNTAFSVSGSIDPDEAPVDAFAPNISAMVGVDLGRLRLFLSGFSQSYTAGELADQEGEYEVTFRNFGAHAQYKLLGDYDDGGTSYVWDWGGLDVTAGITRASTSLSLTTELPTEFALPGTDGASLEANLLSQGTLDYEVTAFTIPVELTTNVTLLSVATLYGGIGTDIQLGDASVSAELDGVLTADDTNGNELDLGTAVVTAEQSADASPGRLRALVGLQVNLWVLKAYAQLNTLPGSVASVATGLKVAF
ncbi:MAG: hypothetical protein AAFX94_06040 [Myxococcota bacterium]